MTEIINGRHQLYSGTQDASEFNGDFRLLEREPYFQGSRLVRGDIFGNPIPVRTSQLPPGYVRLLCVGTGETIELSDTVNYSINGGEPVLSPEIPPADSGVIREIFVWANTASGQFEELQFSSGENGGIFHLEFSEVVANFLNIAAQPLTVLDLSGQNTINTLVLDNMPELVSVFGLAGTSLQDIVTVATLKLKQIDLSGLQRLVGFIANEENSVLEELRLVGTEPSPEGFSLSLQNQNFSAEALNQVFTDLPPTDLPSGDAIVLIEGNPGSAEADRSIATDKGYTVS